ncbi:putative holin-like toxin [Virgibacillus halotolerans]
MFTFEAIFLMLNFSALIIALLTYINKEK